MRGPIFLSCRDSLFCFLSDGTKNVLLYDTVFPLEFLFPSIIKIKYTFIGDFVERPNLVRGSETQSRYSCFVPSVGVSAAAVHYAQVILPLVLSLESACQPPEVTAQPRL